MAAKYQAKKVESLDGAANSNNGGPLFTTLSSIMAFGEQPEHPANEGFFEVATYGSRSSAASTVTNIKNGKRRVPAGRWVFTSKGNVDTNTSTLYAKYLGPEES